MCSLFVNTEVGVSYVDHTNDDTLYNFNVEISAVQISIAIDLIHTIICDYVIYFRFAKVCECSLAAVCMEEA